MNINQISSFLQVNNLSDSFKLLNSALKSTYSVAIWRLPNQNKIHALIDLSGEAQIERELEDLNQCFIINSYHDSHPTRALALKGDILITIAGGGATVNIDPTVTSNELERFEQVVNNIPENTNVKVQDGDHPDFESMVAEAVAQIKAGDLHKVVLSRYKDFQLSDSFDPLRIFQELEASYPNAFCHLTKTKTHGLWIGASPEKLIEIKEGKHFSTDALAGTQPLPEDKLLSDVAWTQKEIEEQAMVSRYIIDCFKKIRLREYDENGPKTVKAGNLAHLKTEYKVDMEATNSPNLGSTMLELLHPTSAVCGSPRDVANSFIKSHEDYDRSLYAGFMGPVGFQGNTNLFVNLRCMQVIGKTARLYAGVGITEDSVPEKELAETDHKMQTLLKVLGI